MKRLMLLIVWVMPLSAMQKPAASATLTPGQRLKVNQFVDAVVKGQVGIVEKILQSKLPIDINDIKTPGGLTLLEKAVYEQNAKMAELLLKYGANPNRKIMSGMTPGKTLLMYAVSDGDAPMVEVLLQHGADQSIEYTDDIAKEGKNMRAIDFLKGSGPQVDQIRKLLSNKKLL